MLVSARFLFSVHTYGLDVSQASLSLVRATLASKKVFSVFTLRLCFRK